jgi:hypothetical protein
VIAPALLLLAQAAAPTPAPSSLPPQPTPIVVESGVLRARVSCGPAPDSRAFCVPRRLEIFRDGEPVYADSFPGETSFLGGGPDRAPLSVRDLGGDGEPEVLFDLYSGGAHCCSSTRIYHLAGRSLRYEVLTHGWGNAGYRLEDLDGDGRLEFLSGDDRFSYAFTSYAASRRPPQIWKFDGRGLQNVTRRYPKLLEEDRASCWSAFEELAPRDPTGDDIRGVLAAYVADSCLLGQCAIGWERLRAAYDKPDRAKFFGELSSFLQKNGYVGRRPL